MTPGKLLQAAAGPESSARMLIVESLLSIVTFGEPSAMVIAPLVCLALAVLKGQVVQSLVRSAASCTASP